jgi:hypothetical protein
MVIADGNRCAGELVSARPIPLDMFIMLDQSTSMSEQLVAGSPQTRWQAVTQAIIDFLNSGQVGQLGMGIGYFGLPDPNGGIGGQSCDPAVYANPAVEIGRLSDAAVINALTASIRAHAPSNLTPTGPAMAGALMHARTWAAAHPDRPTVVVLATDGFPSTCTPLDTQAIANDIVAPAIATDPKVRTFVIAAGSDGLGGLGAISAAGGTGAPVVVVDNANSAAQITDALVRISHTQLACTYFIPIPDGGLDPNLVNVQLTRTGQQPVLLGFVRPGMMCTSAGGFYYDDAVRPTKLSLCPATCDSLVTGDLEIIVGCPGPGVN